MWLFTKRKASQNVVDMTGYEDDNFKVLERDGSSPQGIAYWKCICKHCGNIFTTKGSNIRSAGIQSCGCIHSLGEQKITKMLIDGNYEFSTQYTFSDLNGVGGKRLRFDFAIFSNGELKILLNLMGYNIIQNPKEAGEKNGIILLKTIKRKKEYCEKHNIPLKIIKYDQNFTINDLI